jgi:hypothetical protein
MSRGGVIASGIFRFDERGDVVGFEARRYFDRKSGATLEDWLVRIDPGSVKSFNGIRIPVKSSVTWRLKEGDFTWYRLEISDISYNRWRAADYNSGEWGDEEIQVQED